MRNCAASSPLMQEYGSIAYAMEQTAHAFVAAAKRDLDLFHDNTAKRAPSIAADYMVTATAELLPSGFCQRPRSGR